MALLLLQIAHIEIGRFGFAEALRSAAAQTGDSPLKVTILGSGGGPRVNVEKFGPSILVEAGNEILLFDCGRGTTIRLTEMGIPSARVTKVFLTHLHSDHIIDIPDLYLAAWGAPNGRLVPFEVWGPPGTAEMMGHLKAAFEVDIDVRQLSIPTPLAAQREEGITVVSHDIQQGTVYEQNGVKVTAFQVEHGEALPAFGYRVDYGEYSFAMSGDTRFSENLVEFAQDVDLIVHEAVEPDFLRDSLGSETIPPAVFDGILEGIMSIHTLPEEAGEAFTRIGPRLAVFAHAPNIPSLLSRARQTYSGPLEMAEDLMTIEIGEEISVRRLAQEPPD